MHSGVPGVRQSTSVRQQTSEVGDVAYKLLKIKNKKADYFLSKVTAQRTFSCGAGVRSKSSTELSTGFVDKEKKDRLAMA